MDITTAAQFSVSYHLLVWLFYLLFKGASLHALFGVARTLAVTRPLLGDDYRSTHYLFPLDYSPKVHAFSRRGRWAEKYLALIASVLVFQFLASQVFEMARKDGYPGMGWTLFSDAQVQTLHRVAYAAVLIALVVRAVRGARTYGASRENPFLKTPYDHLNAYFLRARYKGDEARVVKTRRGSRYDVIYTLLLPMGTQVEVRVTGRDGTTFYLPIGENDELVEVNELSTLDPDQEARLAELVAHNKL